VNIRKAIKIVKRAASRAGAYSWHQIEAAKRRIAKRTWHVSAYKVERVYGGPEEGGWWTDWWQLQSSKPVIGERLARSMADELTEQQAKSFDQDAYNREAWARLAALPDPDETPCPEGGSEGYVPRGFSEGEKMVFVSERRGGQNQSTPEQMQYC
tara:strand:- start:787 stop:1251 length:465 start_codon:yes stop_codon:yes gene_type:complete